MMFGTYIDNKGRDKFMKKKKLVIACDVDNVLLDFSKEFQTYCWDRFYTYISNDPINWGFGLEPHVISEYFQSFIENVDQSEFQLVDKNVKYLFNQLALHYDIDLVTAMDEVFSKNRIKNLEGFNYRNIYFVGHNKLEWYDDNKCYDFYIDDKPEIIEGLTKRNKNVGYPLYEYNKHLLHMTYKDIFPYVKFVDLKIYLMDLLK